MRRPPQIVFGAALSLLSFGSALADGIILDGVSAENAAGQGVVPILPLNELGRLSAPGAAATTGAQAGGSN